MRLGMPGESGPDLRSGPLSKLADRVGLRMLLFLAQVSEILQDVSAVSHLTLRLGGPDEPSIHIARPRVVLVLVTICVSLSLGPRTISTASYWSTTGRRGR